MLPGVLTALALATSGGVQPAVPRLRPPDPALAPDPGVWVLLAWSWRPPTMRVVPRSTTPSTDEVIADARGYLGTPYEWGGNNDGGLDCSGFTNKVYADVGYDIPRGGGDQMLVGDPVPFAGLAPGDLLFFAKDPGGGVVSHVALYAGDGEIIHAAAGKGEVTYDRLGSLYYRARFMGARRLLSHPPGVYAAADGSARSRGEGEPPLDRLVASALADDGGTGGGPAAGGAGSAGAAAGSEAALASGLEERPRQLARFAAQPWPLRVGPATLRSEATAAGVRLGVGRLGGSSGLLAAVEASYFDHEDAVAVSLAAPFELPFSGEPRAASGAAGYSSARDYTKILQDARYGQPGSDLYVELGRTASATLGEGQLVRSFAPSLASQAVPDYALFAEHLSLVASGGVAAGGAQLLVDDVIAPRVLGTAVTVRPLVVAGSSSPGEPLATAGVTLAYAVDTAAPSGHALDGTAERRSVHGLSLGVELAALERPGLELDTYIEGATLVHGAHAAAGASAGGLLLATADSRHALRLRFEAGLGSPGYLPGYFDATYALDRGATPLAQAEPSTMSKLEVLDALAEGSGRWSVFVDAGYQLQRRFGLGLAYADGGPLGTSGLPAYRSRNLFVYLELRDLYLPASSRSLSFYLAYHRRGFDSLTPLLSDDGAHEYLFAAARLRSSRYVSVGASLRRALDPTGRTSGLEGVLDLAVAYEL